MSEDHDLNINGTAKHDVANNNSRLGGRIKFFKEGKFILEIKRTCDGDKFNWVSVTKKTYWPSPDESRSTSSLSDDNSSSISSKERTYHSRKQTNPKRSISRAMTFYFHNPLVNVVTTSRKPRRPFDARTNIVVKVRNKKRNRRRHIDLQKVVQYLTDKLTSPRVVCRRLGDSGFSPPFGKRSRSASDSPKSRIERSSPIKLVERHTLEQNHNTSSHIYYRDMNSYSICDKPKTLPVYPYAKWYSNHSRIGYGKQVYAAPEPKPVPSIWRVHTPDDETSDFGDMPLNLSKHTV